MKKICYIISDIDKSVFFEHTAKILKESGFQLSFILINCKNGALDKNLTAQGFEIYNLSLKKLTNSIPVILKCRNILKKIRPDIVHCHLGIANVIGLSTSYLAGIKKRIFTQHGGKSIHRPLKERFLDSMYKFCSTEAIAITREVKNMLVKNGFSSAKVTVINYGFDLQRMINKDHNEVSRIKLQYNKGRKNPVIGVIARWVEWKGIQYIIPAFRKIIAEYPGALLCLFNANENASYGGEIKRLLAELPADTYCIVPFEYNVYDLYQLFDAFIHVPINKDCEAFGQVYVEPLAAGIPSVFTLSGIASEFVKDGKEALVVDFENSDAIYSALKKILTDRNLSTHLINEGRKKVTELFSLEKYKNNLLSYYNSLDGSK